MFYEWFSLNSLFLSKLVDLYIIFQFYFSCSGWGIGPSGGVVEPDLVAKMRSDEGSGGKFIYRMPFLSDWNDDL